MFRLFLGAFAVARSQSSELHETQVHINHNMSEVADVVQSVMAPERCIHAEQGLVAGSLMKLSLCTEQSTQFKWNRDTQQIQVASNPELCVDLTSNIQPVDELLEQEEASPDSTLLQLQPCISGAVHQQWLIGAQMKSKARPDLCITPDGGSLAANASSSALEVAYCKSLEKSQGFRYIAVDDSAELVELVDIAKDIAHAKDHVKAAHFSHSTEVGATGKLHMKHGRKSGTDAKILNLDISESKAHQEDMSDSTLMRRSAGADHEKGHVHPIQTLSKQEENGENGAASEENQSHAQTKHGSEEPRRAEVKSLQPDVDALLERISEGLIEDEDDDEELSAEDLNQLLERAVVAKRRRPPPPPPVPPKINCAWGKWGKWSSCTADCGGGTKDRSRGERIPAENGGLPCDGEAEEEKKCATKPCSPPPPPPTTPPAATTPPPMMAKGGTESNVSLAPAVLVVMLLASCRSLTDGSLQ